jgi:hypothetical protein
MEQVSYGSRKTPRRQEVRERRNEGGGNKRK